MAINKNHEFEELNGVKCSIVEKNAGPARVAFLKSLLEYNKYVVIVVPSPPPKVVATPSPPKPAASAPDPPAPAEGTMIPPTPATGEGTIVSPTPSTIEGTIIVPTPAPETFTIGVTDYTFNSVNAIFGRLLKTPDGHVVTQAFWNQKEDQSNDEVPYYEKD